MKDNTLFIAGFASSLAGADKGVADGPAVIQNSPLLKKSTKEGLPITWVDTVKGEDVSPKPDENVSAVAVLLANVVFRLMQTDKHFCVLGGDHTSALGTWSGVHHAIEGKGNLGLIWIDAHMDSHTPETTESGRIHGMPLASLMGYGYQGLTNILTSGAKLKPENVCLIGVRSYEAGEAALLKRLNVKVFFMEEVSKRGFLTVLREAIGHVSKNTYGYGVSLDLDGIDPVDAPGVDVPEPFGIVADDVKSGLQLITKDPHFLGIEIVEFDPHRDKNQITEKLIVSFIELLANAVKDHKQNQ